MADTDVKRISADQAREYFAHKSQQIGFTVDQVPDDPAIEYYAYGPVCAVCVFGLWPGVFNLHYGVKPDKWGSLILPATRILNALWELKDAELLTGWTSASNRQAIHFAKRLGFEEYGRMILKNETVILQGWKKWA